MARKGKTTRRIRKHRGGGILSFFGFGSKNSETTEVTGTNSNIGEKKSFFGRLFGKKNSSSVAPSAATPVSLSNGAPVAPPAAAPAAGGGKKTKKHRAKKSYKRKSTRKH